MDPTGVDIVISHHGIKGQRWGVRRNRDSGSGSSSSSKDSSDKDYDAAVSRIQHHLKKAGVDSESVKAKYGKDSDFHLTPGQKKALVVGGIAAAVIGISIIESRSSAGRSAAASAKAYKEAVDGLDLNWSEGVHLPKGSIVQRISTVAETKVRPEGFYAAHRPEDIESYKAILPSFWPQWGYGSAKTGGFVNHYAAKVAIKAPSGEKSVDIFKKLLTENQDFSNHILGPLKSPSSITDKEMKVIFTGFSANWLEPKHPAVAPYLKAVKAEGFNALIDFNDAGKLGKQPLRVLNGSSFSIAKSVPLSSDDIKAAAKAWKPELVHMSLLTEGALMSSEELIQDVLEHHGIKGQKWGVRRKHPSEVSVSAKPGKKIRVSGGEKLPAHEDAIKARTAGQKAKKSTTDSLSNQELQALVTRMNLEQQLSNLGRQRKNPAAKFISDVLVNAGKQQVTKLASDQLAKQVGAALGKK